MLTLPKIALLLCLFTALPQADHPVPVKQVRALRGLVDDVAKLGAKSSYEELRALLIEMGDSPKDHERASKAWEKDLAKAKKAGDARTMQRVADNISKQAQAIALLMAAETDDEARSQMADFVLRLDGTNELAHRVLDHVEYQGVWMSDQAAEWRDDGKRVAELVQAAHKLPIEVEHEDSEVEILAELYGEDAAHCVSSNGFRLHGAIAPDRLERILRESMRGAALSNAMFGGELEVPKFTRSTDVVLLRDEAGYEAALTEALEDRSLKQEEYDKQHASKFGGFTDARGYFKLRWEPEAKHQSIVLWHLSRFWLGNNVQPCLLAGQLNWISLSYFGASMPSVVWQDEREDKTTSKRAKREDALWRSASASLRGCRSWIMSRMQAGDKFLYSGTILPELGMVAGAKLLKATLVNEFLQASGRLGQMIDDTRNRKDRIASVEEALDMILPEFEKEWEAWLFSTAAGTPGLAQKIAGSSFDDRESASPEARQFIDALQKVRDKAFKDVTTLAESVELFADLSAACTSHAKYLVINPEQGEAWPDAHEEYADREGFTPEGAWAGGHSVIAFTADPADAVDDWMGTFYHRLPLLEPGLFGVGWGDVGRVSVADLSSLKVPFSQPAWVAWPADSAKKVPLRFQPELPNPVPGEDQADWGYPFTLQNYWLSEEGARTIELSMFKGKDTDGEAVDCHFLSPSKPAFPELAPKDAYCLIPREHLDSNSNYTVLARCPESGVEKTYHFKTGK